MEGNCLQYGENQEYSNSAFKGQEDLRNGFATNFRETDVMLLPKQICLRTYWSLLVYTVLIPRDCISVYFFGQVLQAPIMEDLLLIFPLWWWATILPWQRIENAISKKPNVKKEHSMARQTSLDLYTSLHQKATADNRMW